MWSLKKKGLNRLPFSTTAREFAPAKINLSLHVTGQRADGYHLLDSLVVFAGVGDTVSASRAGTPFTVSGPCAAGVPVDDSNLVRKAACLMDPGGEIALGLEKRLPAASGIGGGSADAAATLRALHTLTGIPLPDPEVVLALGADVPVCLAGRPVRMGGVGDVLAPIPPLPKLWIVLVNPRVEVPTPQVFKHLRQKTNPGMEADLPHWPDTAAFLQWLKVQRNDLQGPALSCAPQIAECLEALSGAKGCGLARMSGSGATCFGLFTKPAEADQAAQQIQAAHRGWWCAAAPMLS